ncbi:MAG: family 78 glycoside hydrolase catalytic domain [Planctomycetes bacterium]|nr:family 78 glycoside hydrolase catalytic domain [Planctomycetota bacterium]
MRSFGIAISVLFFLAGCAGADVGLAPSELICELMAEPGRTVITDSTPELGWVVNSDIKDDVQTAYQILVATSREKIEGNRADMWDSGMALSGESSNVEYSGKGLSANTSYLWKVRIWNKNGKISAYSEVQEFRTGVFGGKNRDWESWADRYPLVKRKVEPTDIVNKGAGHWFVDFGKAAYGTVELVLSSEVSGAEVEVHLGEKLSGEYTVDLSPPGTIRYRKATVRVKKGRHTYTVVIPPDKRNTGSRAIKMPADVGEVLPFRYCEIVGSPSVIDKSSIIQVAVNYYFDDGASHFESSDALLNSVWELCKYSIKATSFCGVYVDGDRERIAYEADAHINQLCHYGVDREYTMARFSHEYLIEHPTWPTEWILHSVLMAWNDYMYTGNAESIERYYDVLKAKSLIALARQDGLISVNTGLVTKDVLESIRFNGKLKDLVDWPPASFTKNGQYGERDHYVMGKVNTVVNAFHYRALVLMGRMAEVLGKTDDVKFFRERARLVRKSINEKLFDEERGVYVDAEGESHSALHANMFPLAFGLVDKEHVASVAKFIKSRGMACSVYGSQHLLDALYIAGEGDYALELMTAKHDRSWYNMMKAGSTVTLEAWDWKYKNNLDWNHAWGAAPADIIPRRLMGVMPLEAGFSKMVIKPSPGGLEKASADVPTIKGTVHVDFDASRPSRFVLNVSIPANTTAKVCMPAGDKKKQYVIVDGVRRSGVVDKGHVVFDNVGSGGHRFERVDH